MHQGAADKFSYSGVVFSDQNSGHELRSSSGGRGDLASRRPLKPPRTGATGATTQDRDAAKAVRYEDARGVPIQ